MIGGIKRRLDAVEFAIRPRDSIEARLLQLTPQQHATYRQWQNARQEWASRFDNPTSLYLAILDGYHSPQMPSSIERLLFGELPIIPPDASEHDLAELYRKAAQP